MTTPVYQGVFTVTQVAQQTLSGTWPPYTVPAVPATQLYGYTIGGYNSGRQSLIDKYTYATDTANAVARNNLILSRNWFGVVTNGINAWAAGGVSDSPAAPGYTSTIERLVFATDTVATTTRAFLTLPKGDQFSGVSNGTNGWFAGGDTPGVPGQLSAIERLIYSADTTNTTVRCNLSLARVLTCGVSNGTNGWFAGGAQASDVSVIDRMTFASDTTDAIARTTLIANVEGLCVAADGTNAWFAGGDTSPGATVQRLVFATDTATTTSRCVLTVQRTSAGGMTDGTFGWYAGGSGGGGNTSIDRITLSSDTTNAVTRANLSMGLFSHEAVNNSANSGF